MSIYHKTPCEDQFTADKEKLEAVTTCVGFDDFLDETLSLNHPHLNTMIVVTSHDDHLTKLVARKHGAILVETDLFKKNGRAFNKGAAINAGFDRFQYHGWRINLDADIILPDNFRRMLFEHTHLDQHAIYGADRVNIVGDEQLTKHKLSRFTTPQSIHGCLVESSEKSPFGARYVDPVRGYCPLGFFQMWHARTQKSYPYSLGDASHDDIAFSASWPREKRIHLPTVICHQLCQEEPKWGENWNGRKHKRFKRN